MKDNAEYRDSWRENELPDMYDYASHARSREEEGTVVAVQGDRARVLLQQGRYCKGCGSCCVLVDDNEMIAEALNRAGAEKGDRVIVDIPTRVSVRAAYILYGIPLLAFLAGFGVGALLGALIFGAGVIVPLGLIFAFTFLALCYIFISRIYSPHSKASSGYLLVVTRILHEG